MNSSTIGVPTAETVLRELLVVESHAMEGGEAAFVTWTPSADLLSRRTPLKNASSTALITTRAGKRWVISLTNPVPWTFERVEMATEFLEYACGRWPWSRLEGALTEHLELPLRLYDGELTPKGVVSVIEPERLGYAIFLRWMTNQNNLPDSNLLLNLKSQITNEVKRKVQLAVASFLEGVVPEPSENAPPSVAMHNYLTGPHQRARSQFAREFPILAGAVVRAELKTLWFELGLAVDRLESPIRFLAEKLQFAQSVVRGLRHTTIAQVGPEFAARPEHLLALLAGIPAEHRPRTPDQWAVLAEQHRTAREQCGHSRAADLLVRARVCQALSNLYHEIAPVDDADVKAVERFRAAVVETLASQACIDSLPPSEGIVLKARINLAVDEMLRKFSMKRLVALAKKWHKTFAQQVDAHSEAMSFFGGQQYFDFFESDGGGFVATNDHRVRCLLTEADLSARGAQLGLCLVEGKHRSVYHRECLRGEATVLAIDMPDGTPASTATFALKVQKDKVNSGEKIVDFRLLEHSAQKNGKPTAEAVNALAEVRRKFLTPGWQKWAMQGVLASRQRKALVYRPHGTSVEILAAGIHAMRATFGEEQTNRMLLACVQSSPVKI